MTEQPRRLTIRLRLTLTYTALILLTGGAMLATVFAVLAIVPGYAFTAGPFPYGTTHDLYTINGRDDVLRLFLIVSLPALLVIGGVGGVVSWFVAGRLLQPLRQIAATAERLDDRNLDARIAVDGPHDEIRDVADTVNAMLDRLEASFTSRSRFTANASHELRTPLASMKTMLQVALRSDHPPRDRPDPRSAAHHGRPDDLDHRCAPRARARRLRPDGATDRTAERGGVRPPCRGRRARRPPSPCVGAPRRRGRPR